MAGFLKPIETKAELVHALHHAAEVEHQLMCVYLYAVLSFKKDPDPTLRPSQLEVVRRWASNVYMVARQEMEHLSFVSGILTAIGELPWFSRENLPKGGLLADVFSGDRLALGGQPGSARSSEPRPRDIPYMFAPFGLATSRNFVCAESPDWDALPEDRKPHWCFVGDRGARLAVAAEAVELPESPTLARSHLGPLLGAAPIAAARVSRDLEVGYYAGLIQELYGRIRDYIEAHPEIFHNANASKQVQIPVEYDIYVFPVKDRNTALRAIEQILREGEGLQMAPGYLSHFDRFFDIHSEYEAMKMRSNGGFEPMLDLIRNPQRDEIKLPYTLEVFDTFNEGYCTLLLMLDTLYANFVPANEEGYPHFSAALQQTAFAPAMTMFVRSLGEVLVQLPIDKRGGHAGPSFYIDDQTRRLLEAKRPGVPGQPTVDARPEHLESIGFYMDRWQGLARRLERITKQPPPPGAPPDVRERVVFIHENAARIAQNLRQIYQAGIFPKFAT